MILSGILTQRNSIDAGYPFLEAILSVLPVVDEMLINDGGSDDGTLKVLKKLQNNYPQKIKLYDIEDYKSDYWETIDDGLEEMMKDCEGEWILELQADEIWTDCTEIKPMIRRLDGFNSIRQPRILIDRDFHSSEHAHWTVRLIRNLPNINSVEGGDCFYLGDTHSSRTGYTCHYVPPEFKWDKPFWHFSNTFPKNMRDHAKRHARFLSTQQDIRVDAYDRLS